ncbi:response regulator transcription factor [Halodurantibacterium flavum]|uniref:Response regulator n=1 Tax=Halodurantibacterium flavum TaxID=1382802 RepID=A0ABW4SBN3_9RHOB
MGYVSDWDAARAPDQGSHARGTHARIVDDILIVDDHPLFCDALSMTLSHAFGLRRARVATNLQAAQRMLREGPRPDAIVLDLRLPDVEGVEGIMALQRQAGDVPVTVISAEIDPAMVTAAMAAGAQGFVSKSLPRARMIEAFERMWGGDLVTPDGYDAGAAQAADTELADLMQRFATLTPQQMNILRLICQGRPNKIISWELSITEATVKTHIAAIMQKINVRNRTQAALAANRARIFSH